MQSERHAITVSRIDMSLGNMIGTILKFWIAWLIAGLIPTAIMVTAVSLLIAAIMNSN